MIHIRNRNDLFKIIEANPPTPAIGQAMVTGGVELLGGFIPVSPSKRSGWVIIVTSERGTVWNVAITLTAIRHTVRAWIVQRIPWEHWVGKIGRKPGIYDGDHPEKYEKKKEKTRIAHGYPDRG